MKTPSFILFVLFLKWFLISFRFREHFIYFPQLQEQEGRVQEATRRAEIAEKEVKLSFSLLLTVQLFSLFLSPVRP